MATDKVQPDILVVEDDAVTAGLLEALLSPLGVVRIETSAETALSLIGSEDWALLIADIELPGMTGLELIESSKVRRPNLATLVLSGHASFEYAVAALRAGADEYLAKPIEPEALIEKASALIVLTAERRKRSRRIVLAIGAHPDDVEIGVGGILLRHASDGDEVTVLTLTGGEAGGEPGERAREAQQAAELLSARLVHADLADTTVSVSDGGRTIGLIQDVIDDIGPDTVYTHTLRDVHQDHRNVHDATLVAARAIPRIYCYEAPSTTVEFQPTRFIGIDDFLERKLEVIRAYASQVRVRDYLQEDFLRATARYWSRYSRARYVEPLEVVRDSDHGASDHGEVPIAEVQDVL
jgi:LmbE family N-acetylglucosaminyl deacetylase